MLDSCLFLKICLSFAFSKAKIKKFCHVSRPLILLLCPLGNWGIVTAELKRVDVPSGAQALTHRQRHAVHLQTVIDTLRPQAASTKI
jgi:hypothetical protein